jgi:glycerol-3-phosphate cytidylyltransferase
MKKIAVTAGQFDLVHAGHVLMFKECREYADELIVLLQTDASKTAKEYRGKTKHKPYMSLKERRIILSSIKYINKIITYKSEEDLFDKLKDLKSRYNDSLIRIIGMDWKGKNFTGKDLDIETIYNSRTHNFSTTNLINKVKNG